MKKPPISEPWQKMAKTTWANAANRRMNQAKAKPAKRKAAKRMHSIWTKDELARVEVLWAEGLTGGQIALLLV